MMEGIKAFFREAWARMTSSKVAWMALPAAICQVWLAISGQDVSGAVNTVFAAAWSLLALFLTVNNPTDSENF